MPTIIHTADRPRVEKMVGGLRYADTQGLLTNANVASATAAKAALAAAVLLRHSAERAIGNKVVLSLDMVGSLDSTFYGGGDIDKATMLALSTAGLNARGSLGL